MKTADIEDFNKMKLVDRVKTITSYGSLVMAFIYGSGYSMPITNYVYFIQDSYVLMQSNVMTGQVYSCKMLTYVELDYLLGVIELDDLIDETD